MTRNERISKPREFKEKVKEKWDQISESLGIDDRDGIRALQESEGPHWLQMPMFSVDLNHYGRKPANVREWVRFLWNIDLFLSGVPILKSFATLGILAHLIF